MAYQSINPFNGELLQTFDQHTDARRAAALPSSMSQFRKFTSILTTAVPTPRNP